MEHPLIPPIGASPPPGTRSPSLRTRLASLGRGGVAAGLVLALGLGATLWGFQLARGRAASDALGRFEHDAERSRLVIQERMKQRANILLGARSLFAASKSVERAEWQAFVRGISIERESPGLTALLYVARVPAPEQLTFETRMRADGAPAFLIHPARSLGESRIVAYVEPEAAHPAAMGYDLDMLPQLRESLDQGRDTGETRLTGLLGFPGENSRSMVALCAPIYRNDAPRSTLEERRSALQGWVLAPVSVPALIRSLESVLPSNVRIEIYDGPQASGSPVVYSEAIRGRARSRRPDFESTATLTLFGRDWSLRVTSAPGASSMAEDLWPWLVLAFGLLGTLLLFGMVYSLATTRARALALAARMTSSLRQSEAEAQKLALVASRTESAVAILDSAGRVDWVNESFLRVTEFAPSEWAGRGLVDLLRSRGSDSAALDELDERLRSGSEWRGELSCASRAGELLWFEAEVQPVKNDRGRIANFVALMSDVTHRKLAEQELLRAKEAALEASRAKSEFLANMSHEIRTPMNGVIGMTELLLDTELDDEQREFAAMVRSSADGLLTIINDILDFSKIEAGKLELDRVNFSLSENLRDTLKPLGFRAHQKSLELALDIAADVPDALLGDPGRLRQIVINLVGNAIKFTERGEVVVDVTVLERSGEDTLLRIEVRDTGIGVPLVKQPHIFDPFTQVDGSTSRRYGGTGLGLAISAQIVRMMGGSIGVESEPGRGSAFHFTARFGVTDQVVRHEAATTPAGLRERTALIVDDNRANRAILLGLLRNWGMKPIAVESGPDALAELSLAQAENRPYSIVLLDVHMPDMDGFQVVEQLKARPALSAIPVVLLTSAGQLGDGSRARELNIAGYLPKPVHAADLLDTMRVVLSEDDRARKPGLVTRHSLRESRLRLRVLLAEDTAVNRLVAQRLLEKHGHHVTAVEDGLQAISALQYDTYDLILLDVQMPGLDGLETARRIREKERADHTHVPIVALTAHAMKGDRERCIEAGMDDYVSKPVDVEQLMAVIERLTGGESRDGNSRGHTHGTGTAAAAIASSNAGLDRDRLLELAGGDVDLLAEMVSQFEADMPPLMSDLRAALANTDGAGAARAAHRIAESLRMLAASAAVELALELEASARAGHFDAARSVFERLAGKVERVGEELAKFRRRRAA